VEGGERYRISNGEEIPGNTVSEPGAARENGAKFSPTRKLRKKDPETVPSASERAGKIFQKSGVFPWYRGKERISLKEWRGSVEKRDAHPAQRQKRRNRRRGGRMSAVWTPPLQKGKAFLAVEGKKKKIWGGRIGFS